MMFTVFLAPKITNLCWWAKFKERFWVFMSGIATPSCGAKIIPNRRYLGAIQACGL
jgi:hypothetical protein